MGTSAPIVREYDVPIQDPAPTKPRELPKPEGEPMVPFAPKKRERELEPIRRITRPEPARRAA